MMAGDERRCSGTQQVQEQSEDQKPFSSELVRESPEIQRPDDLADEGPTAGPASLIGREITRERGWTAPSSDASGATNGTADTMTGAVEQADISRAETETVQEKGQEDK